jgi:hypothetical protein
VEAREAFAYIAKFNGVKDFEIESFKLETQARNEYAGITTAVETLDKPAKVNKQDDYGEIAEEEDLPEFSK